MRKNDSFYTFLLTHTTKEKIFIRRLEISKKLAHSTAASLLLTIGIGSFAIIGAIKSDTFSDFRASLNNQPTTAQVASENKPQNTTKEIIPFNYDRPSSGLAENSGGPNDGSFQLTTGDSEQEKMDIEKKLTLIEKTSNPQFLPTTWAHLGKINNEFGFRRNPFGGRSYEFHAGMDIDGEKGDMVIAPANGTVTKAEWQGGYGYLIEVDHGNGLTTRYGHLSKMEVSAGDTIQRGQLIALVGSTGRSTGPHLHYELRLDDKAINPRRFLPPEPTQIG